MQLFTYAQVCWLGLLLVVSCTERPAADDTPHALYLEPTVVAANPPGGYAVNVLTGASIAPVINALGDTVPTGVPITLSGKKISTEGLPAPRVVPAPTLEQLAGTPARPHVVPVPPNLTVVPIDTSTLKRMPLRLPNAADTAQYVITRKGDTLLTGVPIVAVGEPMPYVPQPQQPMLPLAMDKSVQTGIQYLTQDQGLPTDYVVDMLQDQRGDFWMTSLHAPWMFKYDGYAYTPITTDDVGATLNVFEDHSGYLWFNTRNFGIICYTGQQFIRYTAKDGFPPTFTDMIEDGQGRLWLTSGIGVTVYDGHTATSYSKNEGLPAAYFGHIFQGSHENLWLGTFGAGLLQLNHRGYTRYTVADGLLGNTVYTFFKDRQGNLWVSTDGGIAKFDGTSFTQYPQALVGSLVLAMEEDKNGDLWIASNDPSRGVTRFDGNVFEAFSESEGLSNNYVVSMVQGQQGNLWMGTFGGGVSQLSRNPFYHYSETQGLGSNRMQALALAPNGLWVATFTGNLLYYNGHSFGQLTLEPGLRVGGADLATGGNGQLWISTGNNMLVNYSGANYTYITVPDVLREGISDIYVDKQGYPWFATRSGGLVYYNGTDFVQYTAEGGLISNKLLAVTEDGEGNLWISYRESGITSKLDGEFITHYTEREGLNGQHIGNAIEDHRGNRWFRTVHGVTCYNGTTFAHYTIPGFNAADNYRTLLEDGEGRIWIAHQKGLALMVPYTQGQAGLKDAGVYYTLHTLGRAEGMNGIDIFDMALDGQNQLWLASREKGISQLNLNQFAIPTAPPRVRLNQLAIQGEVPDYRALQDSTGLAMGFDSVAAFYQYPLGLALPHNQNHLTFHYSAIDWAAPHKIRYQYTLNGLENKWSAPTTAHTADYRNLPPGTFTFKVRAVGAAQVWSNTFAYTFTISPPWWSTVWAYVGYGLTLVLLVAAFVRWRTAQLIQQQVQLELMVSVRTEELQQSYEQVEAQRGMLEQYYQESGESLRYAQQIQRSILPSAERLKKYLNEHFVLFLPRNVVSGDFYWLEIVGDTVLVAVADCTGHGVPGALVSLMGNGSLLKAVTDEGLTDTGAILDRTREMMLFQFSKSGQFLEDGMDISLVAWQRTFNTLQWSGAYNPLWLINPKRTQAPEGGVPFSKGAGGYLWKGDRQPIGKHPNWKPFTTHTVKLQPGDRLYLFSDGFADQFGGPMGKKFSRGRLQERLLALQNHAMAQQGEQLYTVFEDWRGAQDQVDDVTLLGFEV